MPDTEQGAAPTAPAAVTADAAAASTSTNPTTTSQPDEPLLSKREIVELRKEMREVAKAIESIKASAKSAPASSPAPQPAADSAAVLEEVKMLRAERLLDAGLLDLGITDKRARAAAERLFKAERPENVGEWLPGAVEALGLARAIASPTPPASPPAQTPPQAPTRSDGGAPAGPRPAAWVDGMNPHQHADLFKTLPPEAKLRAMAAWGASHPNANPYARPRTSGK